jgi:hypothetical protein
MESKNLLWLDDQRRPPSDEWVWARTFMEAIELILTHGTVYDEFSLDHDLSEHEPTGYDFLRWVVISRPDLLPRIVRIHSANPVGAANMQAVIERSGLYPNRTLHGTGYEREDL